MLLNAALIIVVLVLMVVWIWGYTRAVNKPTSTHERDLPWD